MTPVPLKEVIVEDSPLSNPLSPTRTKVKLNIDPEIGAITMDTLQNRYFSIGDTLMEFNHDVTIIPSDQRPAHYSLAILDNYKASVKFNGGEWTNVSKGQSYFTFNPGAEEIHRFVGNHPMKIHFLQVEPGYLTNLLMQMPVSKGSMLSNLREGVMKNEFVGIGSNVSLPAFHNVISAMFACPLQGALGNMMLEGALQQLLALQFAYFDSAITSPKETIRARDKEVMFAVREFLEANVNGDHSIANLSKRFGVNQNKLKTQFKELFGVPVIGYLFDLKMQHAKDLLLDKGLFVSEVASIVGYRNSNHFATAFKRKFGISPSGLKN